uniref:Uncharacterized protein n=1 Tax=Chrysotila carterae TaxID=13221 RepID=A0A7S4BFJ7_CHRCT
MPFGHRALSHERAHSCVRPAPPRLACRRRHGSDDLTEGRRLNLVMWNYNRGYRQSEAYFRRSYRAESRPPDAECVSYTHDRDYEQIRGAYPRGQEHNAAKAWCPPPLARYPGFEGVPGRYRSVD